MTNVINYAIRDRSISDRNCFGNFGLDTFAVDSVNNSSVIDG